MKKFTWSFLFCIILSATTLVTSSAFSQSSNVLLKQDIDLSFRFDAWMRSNKQGDFVYSIQVPINRHRYFFWNQKHGLQIIDVDDQLKKLGYEPIDHGPDGYHFDISGTQLDEAGNVTIAFYQKRPEKALAGPGDDKRTYAGVGIWHVERGFEVLDIGDIVDVKAYIPSPGGQYFLIGGKDAMLQYKVIIIKNPYATDNSNNAETEADTPWANLPLGDRGADLYATTALYKKNRQSLTVLEAQAAHLLDVLQVDLKNAELAIQHAQPESAEYKKAEAELTLTQAQIEALHEHLKMVPASQRRVFSLDLPSDEWQPLECK